MYDYTATFHADPTDGAPEHLRTEHGTTRDVEQTVSGARSSAADLADLTGRPVSWHVRYCRTADTRNARYYSGWAGTERPDRRSVLARGPRPCEACAATVIASRDNTGDLDPYGNEHDCEPAAR
jgi:hypothetical protein